MLRDSRLKVAAAYCSYQGQKERCSMQLTGLTPDQASRIAVLVSGGCLAALVKLGQVVLPEGAQLTGICPKTAVIVKPTQYLVSD